MSHNERPLQPRSPSTTLESKPQPTATRERPAQQRRPSTPKINKLWGKKLTDIPTQNPNHCNVILLLLKVKRSKKQQQSTIHTSGALGDRQTEGPRRTLGSRSPPAPHWVKEGLRQGQVRPPTSAIAVWGSLASNKPQSSRKGERPSRERAF